MAREIFKNLPDTSTPLSASKLNGIFNGEESMGSIVVEDVTCKNMFNKNTVETGYLVEDGSITYTSTYRTSDFIKVKPNTTYYKTATNSGRAKFYDADKNPLTTDTYADIESANEAKSFTTPENAEYLRVSLNVSYLDALQIELGSTGTGYVEHKEFSNKQIYSTSEQVIGTWIDGKPLYRKVIPTTLPTVTTDGTYVRSIVATNVNNVDLMFIDKGIIINGSETYVTPFETSQKYRAWVTVIGTTLYVYNETTALNEKEIYIVINYTKTTDSTSTTSTASVDETE